MFHILLLMVKRLLNLPIFLMELLKKHRDEQLEQQAKVGDQWEKLDLVFPDLHGGYFNPGYLLRLFKKVLAEADLAPI